MAFNVKINPSDLAMLKKKIKQLEDLSRQELSNELGATALEIVDRAKGLANIHKDTGQLLGSINSERLNDKNVRVYANKNYAPYVEFGTGRKVNLKWLDMAGFDPSLAEKFRGKGIRQVNLPARPFFFPAVRMGFIKLRKRLEDKIDNITR